MRLRPTSCKIIQTFTALNYEKSGKLKLRGVGALLSRERGGVRSASVLLFALAGSGSELSW